MCSRGALWWWGVHGRGWHAWQGACMAGGMHGRGHAWQVTCMAGRMYGRGVCMADTMRYGQQEGGTHPTGMHSCFKICFRISYFDNNVHLLFSHQHANCLFLLSKVQIL